MKSIILMTIAIFLMCAPSPDSKTVTEISAGFLATSSETALAAAEVGPKVQVNKDETRVLATQPLNEDDKLVKQKYN